MQSQTDLEPHAKKVIGLVVAASVIIGLLLIFGVL
ncbi:uncharacterized protein METZ01_LOCUS515130 [marine metagenome]|uniref:Uncharacterized protein n=1 Tax=marine metagenome TaxID=408172 RepID=A0A383EZH0_9ZZZZ